MPQADDSSREVAEFGNRVLMAAYSWRAVVEDRWDRGDGVREQHLGSAGRLQARIQERISPDIQVVEALFDGSQALDSPLEHDFQGRDTAQLCSGSGDPQVCGEFTAGEQLVHRIVDLQQQGQSCVDFRLIWERLTQPKMIQSTGFGRPVSVAWIRCNSLRHSAY